MFDLDTYLTTTKLNVNVTPIRIKDTRSGEVYERVIYRPGKTTDIRRVSDELSRFGYQVLWMDDDQHDVPGKMDWAGVFGQFLTTEEKSEEE